MVMVEEEGREEPEENGQGLRQCLCGKERGTLRRIISKAL